jgi:transposase InsO family protein
MIYCSKCKEKTDDFNTNTVQTSNKRWRISAQCLKCKTNKSQFTAAPQEDRLLLAKELHKPARIHFDKRRIITKGIDDLWAADLMDMKKYSKENNGYVYLLNVIDTFSKFVWAFPIKKKDGVTVTRAFEKIIINAESQKHKAPNLLHTDKGLEFKNKHFKTLLNNLSIKMYHTENLEKSAIVERFNRTLNNKMRIQFEVRQNNKWVDVLPKLIDEYNFKDKHRSIGMTPAEVNKSNEGLVLRTLFKQSNKQSKVKFQVGDRVRISKYRYTFGGKYDRKWSNTIYEITEILNTQPVTYKIKDLDDDEEIKGTFYNEELQKTIF